MVATTVGDGLTEDTVIIHTDTWVVFIPRGIQVGTDHPGIGIMDWDSAGIIHTITADTMEDIMVEDTLITDITDRVDIMVADGLTTEVGMVVTQDPMPIRPKADGMRRIFRDVAVALWPNQDRRFREAEVAARHSTQLPVEPVATPLVHGEIGKTQHFGIIFYQTEGIM